MLEGVTYRRLVSAAGITAFSALLAAGQSSQPFLVEAIPVGMRPLGIVADRGAPGDVGFAGWAAVAIAGDDSVSVFEFRRAQESEPIRAIFSKTIRGVPSPYAVVPCHNGTLLVSSPSSNSVSLIDPRAGNLVGTVRVGRQPYAAECSIAGGH